LKLAVGGRFRVPPVVLLLGVLGAIMLFYSLVHVRGGERMATAERIRQIKQAMEIYAGTEGGFPANLAVAERRFGPIPVYARTDAWGRTIEYNPSRPLGGASEGGDVLFAQCEVRSAGPNGTPGDDDDLVWRGTANDR
jgi:hypothetical protein